MRFEQLQVDLAVLSARALSLLCHAHTLRNDWKGCVVFAPNSLIKRTDVNRRCPTLVCRVGPIRLGDSGIDIKVPTARPATRRHIADSAWSEMNIENPALPDATL